MKFLLIAFVLLSSLPHSYAQNRIGAHNDSIKQKSAPTITNNPSITIIDENNELKAYKLLYESVQKNNDNLSETTHWTIGIVIAFILLILGSQFLYNWRLNKQEIETIRSEIEVKFQELEKELNLGLGVLSNELKKDIEDAKKENYEYLKEEFDRNNRLNEKLNNFDKKEIERQFLEIKTDLKEHDGDIWLLKGVNANALTSFIKTAEFKLELGQEIKYTLSDIIDILKKVEEVHTTDFYNLDKLIVDIKKKLPGTYDTQLTQIEQSYKDKQIYTYERSTSSFGLTGAMSGASGIQGFPLVRKIVRPKKT